MGIRKAGFWIFDLVFPHLFLDARSHYVALGVKEPPSLDQFGFESRDLPCRRDALSFYTNSITKTVPHRLI